MTLGTYSVGETDAALFDVISRGATGTEMPPFTLNLSDEDIWRIVAYVRSVARRETAAVAGDREAGRKQFGGKGQCGR